MPTEQQAADIQRRLKDYAAKYLKWFKEPGRKRVGFRLPEKYGGNQGGVVQLTLAEYEELKEIMEDGKKQEVLIFEPFSMGMVDFSLRIYRRPLSLRERPVPLFVLGGSALPEELRKAIKKEKGHPAFILDDAFNEYSPWSHSKENQKLLAQFKLEPAHDFSHFDY